MIRLGKEASFSTKSLCMLQAERSVYQPKAGRPQSYCLKHANAVAYASKVHSGRTTQMSMTNSRAAQSLEAALRHAYAGSTVQERAQDLMLPCCL